MDWLRFSNPAAKKPASDAIIRRVFEAFDTGMPGITAQIVAKEQGLVTAEVTKIAKWLAEHGLLFDTGYAMKEDRYGSYQYTERPKTEGGMVTKPGASTQWETLDVAAEHGAADLAGLRVGWSTAQESLYERLHAIPDYDAKKVIVREALERVLA